MDKPSIEISDAAVTRGLLPLLASAPFFQDVPREHLPFLASQLEWLSLPGGWPLFQQGDRPDAVYLVLSGRLGAFVEEPDGSRIQAGEITANEVVGEMALLTGQPRSATVLALRDTTVLRCPIASLEKVIAQYPDPTIAIRIMRLLAARLERSIHRKVQPSVARTFAIVPIGPQVPIAQVTAQLAVALRRYGLQIESLTPADAEHSTEWFHRVEAMNAAVIYQAEPTGSVWTKLCLRQADCVLLVARARDDPTQRSVIELQPERFNGRGWVPHRELVLLHDRRTVQPSGTAGWLADRNVRIHHHVRLGRAVDFERLARMLTGRAVGLVLSGGVARGAGHIGAVRALRESGMPIDLVGGTSIGASVAAAVACDWDHRIMREMYCSIDSGGILSDYTVPLVALAGGRRLSRLIQERFGDLNIEDLWVPLFCVSSNLTTGTIAVHNRGPVWRAIRASVSLPGLLPPVIERGEVLVDGGIMDNLPVDVMARYARGPIVAVDVSTEAKLSTDAPDPGSLPFWRVLAGQFGRQDRRLPNIFQILWSAGMTSMRSATSSVSADLLLRPPLTGVNMLDWKAVDRAAKSAHRYTVARLAQLRNTPDAGKFFPGSGAGKVREPVRTSQRTEALRSGARPDER